MQLQGPSFYFEPSLFAQHVAQHAPGFLTAAPFPHAVIDDFLPGPLADALAAGFPAATHPHFRRVDHAEQSGRLGHLQRANFAGVDPLVRHTLDQLNGAVFLGFLEELTGVRGLIGDPSFRSAGVHITLPHGHLDLHADFNRDRFRELSRALTVLLYLNPGWQAEWGGALELWTADRSTCAQRIAPFHNRCVVMVNAEDGYHGHPQPLGCPSDRARQSLVAYYYQSDEARRATDPGYVPVRAHGAIWVRPR